MLRGERVRSSLAVGTIGIVAVLLIATFYQTGLVRSPRGPAGGFNYLRNLPGSWGPDWNATLIQANLDRIVGLGGSIVRVFFANSSAFFANGTCQSSYFDHLDDFLGWAGSRGLRAVVNLGVLVDTTNLTASEASFDCFSHRYSGDQRVYLWELTNEPDQKGGWNSDFWGKLKAVYGYVKSQDPTHQVTLGIAYSSNMAWFCQNVFVPDVPQYHEYSPWEGPTSNETFVAKVVGDIDAAYSACGNRPVLIGETGFPSAPAGCGLSTGCSPALEAGYLGLVLKAVDERCKEVSAVLVWTLTDYPHPDGYGTEAHFGVYAVTNGTYAEKPAAATVEGYFSGLFKDCG